MGKMRHSRLRTFCDVEFLSPGTLVTVNVTMHGPWEQVAVETRGSHPCVKLRSCMKLSLASVPSAGAIVLLGSFCGASRGSHLKTSRWSQRKQFLNEVQGDRMDREVSTDYYTIGLHTTDAMYKTGN